jgi:HEPN domain-containing protein
MTPHDRALELLRLAKRDEHGAHILQADPTADVALIGFHYQQAAEKLLKALLAEQDVDYPLTHDLERLLKLVEGSGYHVPVPESAMLRLTPFAVTSRYEEDEESQQLDPVETSALISQLRGWAEGELGVDGTSRPSSDG